MALELVNRMSEIRRKSPNLKSHLELKPFGCRTILQFLFCLALPVSLISCGPTSINNYHGSDKVLANGNSETRGGGGTGDGGGGQGIVCTSEVKEERLKNRLFVRDIFEAIINHHRNMKYVESPSASLDKVDPQAIKVLVDSIKLYFGPATRNLEFGNEKFWTDFAERISFLNEETPLFPSNDANSPIALPVGCQITQLAYWDESAGSASDGTLYVDKKKWQQLDQFNKIALLAHEYFFKQARKAGYKNSDFTRFKVGQLLSVEGLEPISKEWAPAKDPRVKDILPESKNGFKFCQGTSSEDPAAQLYFYQYEGKDKFQHFVFPFLKSNSINLNLFQGKDFTIDPKAYQLPAATDLLIYGSDFDDDPESLFLKSNDNELTLWYKGTGLLYEPGGAATLVSTVHAVQSAMENLSNFNKTVLWLNHTTSANQTIQFSLLNPAINYNLAKKRRVKTRESLTASINRKIEDAEDISYKIDPGGFEENDQDRGPLEKGRILVQQGNDSLTFTLSCKDYTSIYVEATDHRLNLNENVQLKNDIPYEMMFFKSNEEIELQEKEIVKDPPVEVVDHRYTEKEIKSDIKSFLTFLTSKEIKSEKYQQFWNTDSYNCNTYLGVNGFNCADFKMLDSDLNTETKIKAMPCHAYYGHNRGFNSTYEIQEIGEKVRVACVLIQLNSAKNSYIITFSNSSLRQRNEDMERKFKAEGIVYKNQEFPRVNFIRRIAL